MNPYETQGSTPMSNFQQPNDNPLSPKGRFTRLSYLAWNGVLGLILSFAFFVIIILGFGGAALAATAGTNPWSHPLVIFALFLLVVSYIIFFVALICILIRRLHDLNKSGWLWLIMFIPLVSLFFAIYVCVAKGSKIANGYGEFRPTEQAERYLGIAYAIFLAIFMSLYLVIAVLFISAPDLFKNAILNSESALINNNGAVNTMSDEELEELRHENAELQEEINSNVDEMNTDAENSVQETDATTEEVQNAADQAVEAANAAAEAASQETSRH